MSIFYCSGIIPVLLSSALIKSKFKDEKNVIILENAITIPLWISFSQTSKYENVIAQLILKSVAWDEVHSLHFTNSFISFRRLFHFIKKLPLENIRIIKDKKSLIKKINNIFKNNIDSKIIVSDNSILLKYFYDDALNISYLEHGAASYASKLIAKDSRYYVKKVISKLSGVNLNRIVDNIYLSDNGKSSKSKKILPFGSGVQPISCDLSSHIIEIYSVFIERFKVEHYEAFMELEDIKSRCIRGSLFIYLPTGIVQEDEYSEYLKNQLSQFDALDGSEFLIKPHGNDTNRDYSYHFTNCGASSFSFVNKINVYIPVEFLILYFENAKMVSSYSTAHLYINWWLNKSTIFTRVLGSSVDAELLNEYRPVLDDIENLLLKQ